MNSIVRNALRYNQNTLFHLTKMRTYISPVKGVNEPEYLDYLTPQIPFYPLVNIQVKYSHSFLNVNSKIVLTAERL